MNRKITVFIALILLSLHANARTEKQHKNTVYYEYGGIGLSAFSINYDHIFQLNKRVSFIPGLGISILHESHITNTVSIANKQVLIPVQFNFLFGKSRHKFELGFGMPFAIRSDKFGFESPGIYISRFGYRFQSKNSGFMFRASLNPMMIFVYPLITGGLGIGYVF